MAHYEASCPSCPGKAARRRQKGNITPGKATLIITAQKCGHSFKSHFYLECFRQDDCEMETLTITSRANQSPPWGKPGEIPPNGTCWNKAVIRSSDSPSVRWGVGGVSKGMMSYGGNGSLDGSHWSRLGQPIKYLLPFQSFSSWCLLHDFQTLFSFHHPS